MDTTEITDQIIIITEIIIDQQEQLDLQITETQVTQVDIIEIIEQTQVDTTETIEVLTTEVTQVGTIEITITETTLEDITEIETVILVVGTTIEELIIEVTIEGAKVEIDSISHLTEIRRNLRQEKLILE